MNSFILRTGTWAAGVAAIALIAGTRFLSPAAAEEWRPADGPLMTPWAKDVSPENVWPEYPRPQMVRPRWENLNGLWDYAITAKAAGRPEAWDGKILVPFCVESALSGVMKRVAPEQRLWYRRTFARPALAEGERLLLHFGAVDWEAAVWVNGAPVGEHRGGYTPFHFDITAALTAEGPQELVVAVWDPTDKGFQPRGKQVLNPHGIWYTPVTGIWQTVWLEPVPANAIESLRITPDVDAETLSLVVQTTKPAKVRAIALAEGRQVAAAEGASGEPLALKIADARLWSPDDPYLYDLQVELADGDAATSYFGMRKIEVAKDAAGVNRLLLNGEVLFQYGPLDQGWWPDGLYTAATDEAFRFDVEMTKKHGMNMARKHVKIEPARWYYWCDKLGLLVWQDMPNGHNGSSEEAKANFERELKAMVDAFYNHPSIVMWVPFNEGWGQHDTERYVELIQQWDPTRLVNNASGWTDKGVGHVRDIHAYPGPATAALEEDRAVVLGEFGGLGLPLPGHTWQDEKNWGYRSFETREALTEAYLNLLHRLRPLIGQGLAAAVYTQTSDVEIEVNGLMNYDRKVVKMDLERVAEAARRLYLPPPQTRTLVPAAQEKPVTWRYTFEQPAEGWQAADFDDRAWREGPAGFGTENTPGTMVRTRWDGKQIWVRRTFELDRVPEKIELLIHHDEDADVYLNGVLAASLTGFTVDYVAAPVSAAARDALRQGKNTIAIYCRQTMGGQYIDAGLIEVVEE